MRDPFLWSIPLGRLFGINIRVHLLYPAVALGFILRVAFQQRPIAYPEGTWIDATVLSVLLLGIVLLHELGHCFAGRWVGGEASEILIWPLGGLAYVDVPHTPRANFITAAAGPAANLLLCVVCALLLAFATDQAYQPPWSPLWSPFRSGVGLRGAVEMTPWGAAPVQEAGVWPVTLARTFYLSWMLFWFNVLLVGFPLDGGRMLQCTLWPYLGYAQATRTVIFTGFFMMFVVGIAAIFTNEILPLFLAAFIYVACKNQWILLESGGEEGLFGVYDFSQGYTSLEREGRAAPSTRRVGWWQRWRQRVAARKLQRQLEQRDAEEKRFDQLLEKVHREGMAALTDEERRFMNRFSDRYRNRN
jgi:Zn-dependent protease